MGMPRLFMTVMHMHGLIGGNMRMLMATVMVSVRV
jgi:hypothetical protein